MSSRRPPTRMPTMPFSQPWMTVLAPSSKLNGELVQDDWTTLCVEYVANTYCTLRVSPLTADAPVPLMRSDASSAAGAAVVGTTTVGATPNFPEGDGSGIVANPATGDAVLVEATVVVVFVLVVVVLAVVVLVVAMVVVVADAEAVVVVVVGVVDLPEKRSAPVTITTIATTAIIAPRCRFFRRFLVRCSSSILARRADF